MARTALCIPCNQEFPSEASFQEHKKSGHKTKGVSLVAPQGTPTPEFLEQVQRIEGKKEPVDNTNLKMPDPKPISLTYVFVGECPSCHGPVTTLEVDVEKEHVCICYCNNEKKQLESRKVEKL